MTLLVQRFPEFFTRKVLHSVRRYSTRYFREPVVSQTYVMAGPYSSLNAFTYLKHSMPKFQWDTLSTEGHTNSTSKWRFLRLIAGSYHNIKYRIVRIGRYCNFIASFPDKCCHFSATRFSAEAICRQHKNTHSQMRQTTPTNHKPWFVNSMTTICSTIQYLYFSTPVCSQVLYS